MGPEGSSSVKTMPPGMIRAALKTITRSSVGSSASGNTSCCVTSVSHERVDIVGDGVSGRDMVMGRPSCRIHRSGGTAAAEANCQGSALDGVKLRTRRADRRTRRSNEVACLILMAMRRDIVDADRFDEAYQDKRKSLGSCK